VGFPENILTKDEKVVRSLHPHWLTIFKPVMLGLLIIAIAAVIVWLTPVHPTWDIADWVIIAIGIIVLLWVVVLPFLKWRTTHYVITNKRVVVRRGILTKSGQDIALSKITDVSFRQSVLDRITKAGSLNIETAGDSPDEDFSSIPRSNEIQQLLNHLIEEDVAAKGGYGGAAYRGHQMMGHRSYDAPTNPQQQEPRPAGAPADAQQPPPFEQAPTGPNDAGHGRGWDTGRGWSGNDGSDRGGGWNTDDGPQQDPRGYRAPDERGGSSGDQWETPPTR
jgi:membrane protein YdbS with pleckstrin-like domain